jgi:alkaline phosphatase
MDVIMGAGNPQYNDNGVKTIDSYNHPAINDTNARYVGGRDSWIALNNATHSQGWKLIQSKAEFEAIANGTLPSSLRVVGVPEVATTLQQSRSGYAPTDPVDNDPMNANVPTLKTMTQAAVNLLQAKSQSTGDKGFFLQVEGGAVDWAAHANQTSRTIEEQRDFNNTVDWVVGWIEANGGWANNLLIITTDHANSMPLGPNSDAIPFDSIEIGDVSGVPNIKWHSGSHMNQLVPLFVRGAGADMFAGLVDGTDTYFGTYYHDWTMKGFDGRYVDNTDIGVVLNAAVVPLPATVYLLAFGLGGLGLLRRRPLA